MRAWTSWCLSMYFMQTPFNFFSNESIMLVIHLVLKFCPCLIKLQFTRELVQEKYFLMDKKYTGFLGFSVWNWIVLNGLILVWLLFAAHNASYFVCVFVRTRLAEVQFFMLMSIILHTLMIMMGNARFFRDRGWLIEWRDNLYCVKF